MKTKNSKRIDGGNEKEATSKEQREREEMDDTQSLKEKKTASARKFLCI